jgi:hypothetical protein
MRFAAHNDAGDNGGAMASVWVVEVGADDRRVQRGLYHFLELPAAGDRVTLPNGRGTLDVMGVVMVEHAPVPDRPPLGALDRREPLATIFVQWIEEDSAG